MASPSSGIRPAIDATWTMLPPPRARRRGSARRVRTMGATRLTWMMLASAAGSCFSTAPRVLAPALLTRTSRPPRASSTERSRASQAEGSPRSHRVPAETLLPPACAPSRRPPPSSVGAVRRGLLVDRPDSQSGHHEPHVFGPRAGRRRRRLGHGARCGRQEPVLSGVGTRSAIRGRRKSAPIVSCICASRMWMQAGFERGALSTLDRPSEAPIAAAADEGSAGARGSEPHSIRGPRIARVRRSPRPPPAGVPDAVSCGSAGVFHDRVELCRPLGRSLALHHPHVAVLPLLEALRRGDPA